MIVAADEFLLGQGVQMADAPSARRWLRPAVQWLTIGTAHAAMLAAVLHVSPQARQTFGEIVQASLIAPQAKPLPKPAEPPRPIPPRKPQAPRVLPSAPAPALAAAPAIEPSPASFVVTAPPVDPVPEPPAPAPADPAPATVAAPAPPLIPPVFNADYLDNPPPQYPPMSRRLGETGRVLLRVFVSADGRAERVEIRVSSGFGRLDDAARDAVARWRFVPARRGEAQVAAWVQVPIVFVM